MAHGGFLSSSSGRRSLDVSVDLGHPFLNRTVDGFLKIGAVGACKVAADETFHCLHKGDVSKNKVEHVVSNAIAGAAIATAAQFLNHLTCY